MVCDHTLKMNCAVKGCKNYYRKTKNFSGETVKYFSFPKDEAVCIKWREVCANQDISVIKGKILRKYIVESMLAMQNLVFSCNCIL